VASEKRGPSTDAGPAKRQKIESALVPGKALLPVLTAKVVEGAPGNITEDGPELGEEDRCGSGAFSKVYKAVLGNRNVILKVLQDTAPKMMLLHEVCLLSQISHENLVNISGVAKLKCGIALILGAGNLWSEGVPFRNILKHVFALET
jgi:hypothetical protein